MYDSTNTSVNPDDFIITRKRKKYKFAKFFNSPICFELDEWTKRPIDVVEIGAGTGRFCLELAARYPEKTFVAIDVKADRLQKGAYEATERGVSNIFFVRMRADQLDQIVDENTVENLWITFADPFPKARSAGRRMTHPTYLSLYQKLLRPDGSLLIKHDNPAFFQWSLEQLVESDWRISELSFDLHGSSLPDDYKIKTDYERRWLDEGLVTQLVRATPATIAI